MQTEKLGNGTLRLVISVSGLLSALNVDGTCQICEQGVREHLFWCPVLKVVGALEDLAHIGNGCEDCKSGVKHTHMAVRIPE